jgi:hypothetical protein
MSTQSKPHATWSGPVQRKQARRVSRNLTASRVPHYISRKTYRRKSWLKSTTWAGEALFMRI